MLTDDEARNLLHRAADTVAVDPTGRVEPPARRPRWPLLAAAAAAVAIAVVAAVLTRPGSDVSPSQPPAAVQVPSLLGYGEAEAAHALESAGLQVGTAPEESCDSGRVLGTDPAAGTPVETGATVTLRVANGALGYCVVDEIGWRLLAFADGRGGPPPLASTVRISDRSGSSTVTAARAADPETWRPCPPVDTCTSVLAELREEAMGFHPDPRGGYLSPILSTAPSLVDGQFATRCSYDGPDGGADYARVAVVLSEDDCAPLVLDVYRDHRAITEVVLRHSVPRDEQPTGGDIGPAFVEFARGGELPPLADEVDLYLGNAFTGTVTREQADGRGAWATCTEVGSYAGRTCPLSPVELLRDHRGEFADHPQGICMPTYGPLPPELRRLDRTVVVPAKGSIHLCMDNFAVQLFTDDRGRLVAVSTLLGEP